MLKEIMERLMENKRVMGIETEYGIEGGEAGEVVRAYEGGVKEHKNFTDTNKSVILGYSDLGGHVGGDYGNLYGLNIEGYTSGLRDTVIENGGRFYVDMGHPEYCTPEVSSALELVAADKAGERIVLKSAKNAGGEIKIYKNNSDGRGNSFGCHENYLIGRHSSEDFKNSLAKLMTGFFVTRQLFTGSGKIGIESSNDFSYFNYVKDGSYSRTNLGKGSYERKSDEALETIEELGRYFIDIAEFSEVKGLLRRMFKLREEKGEMEIYQLSQRADFIKSRIGLQTTANRPIINTRDEPHADKKKYMRLHVINGDANMCEVATYLKAGTTGIVLDLIEDGLMPEILIDNPIKEMQNLSWDQSRNWNVAVKGKTISAIDVQKEYLNAAKEAYSGRDKETDDILFRWGDVLDKLKRNPMELVGVVDWVTKLHLLSHLMQSGENINDKKIKNAALQYHDLDMKRGLFNVMQTRGLVERIVKEKDIIHAVSNPGEDTRAWLRGKILGLDYVSSVDWGKFSVNDKGKKYSVSIDELFAGNRKQVGDLKGIDSDEFINLMENIDGISVSENFRIGKYVQKVININSGKKKRNKGGKNK
jgi:proteasome accessory factor A